MADKDITYRAPVLPIDLDPDGYVIWPCPDCLPWHAEVITDEHTGLVLIREWHAVGCRTFKEFTD